MLEDEDCLTLPNPWNPIPDIIHPNENPRVCNCFLFVWYVEVFLKLCLKVFEVCWGLSIMRVTRSSSDTNFKKPQTPQKNNNKLSKLQKPSNKRQQKHGQHKTIQIKKKKHRAFLFFNLMGPVGKFRVLAPDSESGNPVAKSHHSTTIWVLCARSHFYTCQRCLYHVYTWETCLYCAYIR